jgi:hypothetical protein
LKSGRPILPIAIWMLGHTHLNCANCLDYALAWADELLAPIERAAAAAHQLSLAGVA